MYDDVTRIFDIPAYQQQHYPQPSMLASKLQSEWVRTSTESFVQQVNQASRGLLNMGVVSGDKIAMISNNRYEWNIMDMAILQIGAIDVPIYPTISEKDYSYIMNDAGVKIVIVSDNELLQKVNQIKEEVSTLEKVFSFEKIEGTEHWSSILEAGVSAENQAKVEALKLKVTENDLATLIYTSGTTGLPKGVMLSHKNLVSNCVACTERFPMGPGSKSLSFLPVCHVYERMILYLYMLKGIQIHFAESMETIVENLQEVQPQVFTAVPRLLEKVYDKILAKGEALKGIKRKLFFWAVELGLKFEPYRANGDWYEFQLKIARKLIFSKWQAALGGNVELIASGSAALQPRLARVFHAADIDVMEGYGLTETSPVISVNEQANGGLMFGSVGRPITGVEVMIAEDGEILAKGPNIMLGYYKNEEKTKEVLDQNGWFHTGDIGELVNGEFIRITDRKKEMFKTSGGKYIAPQVLENKFKESRFIEQIIVIGEYKKHPAALVVPTFDFLKEYCAAKGITFTSNEQVIKEPRIIARIQKEISAMNELFGNWERVKKFELLPLEFSVDSGELTPTLKLKRKVIMQKHEELINSIYA
jgi:long-chain acyl-CoA synthetase